MEKNAASMSRHQDVQLSWANVVENTRTYRDCLRFPDNTDSRSRDGMLFPAVHPRFSLAGARKIFTIGSCFARNIEEKLTAYDVPTLRFRPPREEYLEGRSNALLNEYNPGTMSQRIQNAFGQAALIDDTIVDTSGGVVDLLLPTGTPVTRERAFERRREISALYEELASSDAVIITLGLVQAWYDTVSGAYLNRLPPRDVMRTHGDRYVLRVLDVADAFPLLDEAIGTIVSRGIKVLLTVSPVPLQASLGGGDAVVANCYSKSVLRVCAQELYMKYPLVDYFPSYEIAMSGGLSSFAPDQVHVRDTIVGQITEYMLLVYVGS
jgi:hypothetical protein